MAFQVSRGLGSENVSTLGSRFCNLVFSQTSSGFALFFPMKTNTNQTARGHAPEMTKLKPLTSPQYLKQVHGAIQAAHERSLKRLSAIVGVRGSTLRTRIIHWTRAGNYMVASKGTEHYPMALECFAKVTGRKLKELELWNVWEEFKAAWAAHEYAKAVLKASGQNSCYLK